MCIRVFIGNTTSEIGRGLIRISYVDPHCETNYGAKENAATILLKIAKRLHICGWQELSTECHVSWEKEKERVN